MIFFPKNKLQLRFLLKIQISDDGVKFNKLTTFLNQLQVEDSSSLDELLLEHFTEWKNNFITKIELPLELHSIVHITLWKTEHVHNFFTIQIINPIEYLKRNPQLFYSIMKKKKAKNSWNPTPKNFRSKILKTRFFNFSILCFIKHEYDDDNSCKFLNLCNSLSVWGSFHSLRFRKKMLGRKINFRRKVYKKKFEDYD